MAPKKRKQNFEHDKVTIGRAKIRKGDEGKKLVEDTPRKNILMLLENLSDEEAKDYTGRKVESKLSAAVTGAADPSLGPEAVIDLESYGFDDMILFGNKQAGRMMATLLNMLDDGGANKLNEMHKSVEEEEKKMQKTVEEEQKKAEDETSKKDQVEQTLGYLQALLPLSQAGQKNLASDLENLDGPLHDAGWLYGVLWGACLQWMDARLRQLRRYGINTSNKVRDPLHMCERNAMINCRIHGGNLRVDAIMCQIKYGDYRHNDANYDVFFRNSFKNMYRMTPDDGYWLAKHGDDASRGVERPSIIGFIDKFVYVIDSVVADEPGDWPRTFEIVLGTHFPAYTTHVAHLIAQARGDENWQVDAADSNVLETLRRAVYTGCCEWKVRGDGRPLWDRLKNMRSNWSPADFLRDLAPKKQRIVGPAGARMRLRPQARVDYST